MVDDRGSVGVVVLRAVDGAAVNALQRRRFARSMVAAKVGDVLWVRVPSVSGAFLGGVVPGQLEALERDTRRDLARSGGPSLFRSSCKGILRALARWRAATA